MLKSRRFKIQTTVIAFSADIRRIFLQGIADAADCFNAAQQSVFSFRTTNVTGFAEKVTLDFGQSRLTIRPPDVPGQVTAADQFQSLRPF